jgi:hypothetical protein
MKITKAQLRQIIKEELGNLVGETKPEEVGLKPDAWEGGENLVEPMDLADILFGTKTVSAVEDKPGITESTGRGVSMLPADRALGLYAANSTVYGITDALEKGYDNESPTRIEDAINELHYEILDNAQADGMDWDDAFSMSVEAVLMAVEEAMAKVATKATKKVEEKAKESARDYLDTFVKGAVDPSILELYGLA